MPLKIGYWNIRGLGAPLRMMCEHANVCYEAVNYIVAENDMGNGGVSYDASSWFSDKTIIKKNNPLANLPYIEDGDGSSIISQTNACLLHLGEKFGLLGSSPQDRTDCEQLLCEIMDMRNAMVAVFYGGSGHNLNGELENLMTLASLGKLELWLKSRKGHGKFLVCDTPCAPDFHLFELLDQLRVLSLQYNVAPWGLNNCLPLLSKFYSDFDELPFLIQYRASLLAKLPINNKMAKYGAGSPFIPEREVILGTNNSIGGGGAAVGGGGDFAASAAGNDTGANNTPSKSKKKQQQQQKQATYKNRFSSSSEEIELDPNIYYKNENTICFLRGPRNNAFMFLKPHAVTQASVALVKGFLINGGFKIISEGRISCEEIDSKQLIDKHYYGIASKATLLSPHELQLTSTSKNLFLQQFQVDWDEALEKNLIFNAMNACEFFGIEEEEMDYEWSLCRNSRKMVKLGGGFYCGLIEIKGKSAFVINGFFMKMRAKFTTPGDVIYFFSVSWDPSQINWSWFRSKGCGDTDPTLAPLSSLRGLLHTQWEELGLKHLMSMMDNGIHVSASPFEALVEHMNWFGCSISSDPFGKQLLSAGVLEESILRWSLDPQVLLQEATCNDVTDATVTTATRKPVYGSLFELVEDKNSPECIAELVALQARERESVTPTAEKGVNSKNPSMETVRLKCGNSEALVYLHGAHVSSWKVSGVEKLFMSKQTVYNGAKALRGGIPVCWPQFSDMGPCKTQHGFARNFTWKLVDDPEEACSATSNASDDRSSCGLKKTCCGGNSNSNKRSCSEGVCVLRLDSDMVRQQVEKDGKASFIQGWNLDHPNVSGEGNGKEGSSPEGSPRGGGGSFVLEMKLSLCDNTLKQEFRVTNPSTSNDLTFTCALHTYFACSNASQGSVEGLYGTTYLDNLENRVVKSAEEGGAGHGDVTVLFKNEVDRIYQNVPRTITIRDGDSGGGGIKLKTNENFKDAIVWNPFANKAKKMADFGDHEYHEMICCEVGVTKHEEVTLKPQETWVGVQKLRAI